MAAAALVRPVVMSRLTEQQSRGYSWPPTPPRWTREEQNEATNRKEQYDDSPIIVSDSDSDDEPADDPPRTDALHTDTQQRREEQREGKEEEGQPGVAEHVEDDGTHANTSSSSSPGGERTTPVAEDGVSSSSEDEEGENGDEEGEQKKAHDSEETEDEDNAALEEVGASSSVVQDIRDVQHEDFNASQREMKDEADFAAAVVDEAQQQPRMDETGDLVAQQRDKRPHDAVSGASEQPAHKQLKSEPLPTTVELRHDNDELMIDEVRTKVSISRPSLAPAAITPPTHTYFASSCATVQQSQPFSATQPAATTLPTSSTVSPNSPTLPPSLHSTVPAASTGPSPPIPTPPLKLLRSAVYHKLDRPPITLNLSPHSTLFYADPDTSNLPPTAPLPPIKRTGKKQRTQLAAWQLLQRQDELEEELAAADEAMEKDQQAGKEVAEKWEKKIDALQEETDEIEDELEARHAVERERDRKEREAWYTYMRLGATEEDVKRMDEEDAKATAELGYSGSDDDVDDSEESAEEEDGGEEEERKEMPAPTSPPSNPFEKAEQPAAAHFKNALNEWQQNYHDHQNEYKRTTDSVYAGGGFVSGLFFEKGRKEEVKGGRQAGEKREQQGKDETKEESKEAGKDEKKEEDQPAADKREAVANKENVPLTENSPKLSPPATVSSSSPAIASPPVHSNKSNKPPVPPAPSLLSKSVSPPPASSATPPQSSTTAPHTTSTSSPTESRPAVKSAAVSSFFSSSRSSSSSANQSTSSRRCIKPQLIRSGPANLVVNGGQPRAPQSAALSSRVVSSSAGDDMIDLTDD